MIRVAHFSDIHLGYEAYTARSVAGGNQRGEDVVRALHQVVSDIVATDAALVICSGDVAELPLIPVNYMLAASAEFQRLAGIRPDGSRRQVVIIAGNHDQSKHVRAGCFLDLYRGLPGISIVSAGYEQVKFSETELSEVIVHALPHSSLKDLDKHQVVPLQNKINILTTHGVADSSELYRRAIGKEYIIPAELMLQDWEYVALGHWHKQGPVFPLGFVGESSKIWYAGSLESIGFSDVAGGEVTERGWLLVEVSLGEDPIVIPQKHSVRAMVNLEEINASGLSPEKIQKLLEKNLTPALAGSVARQRITGMSRDLWSLLDTTSIYRMASHLIYYRIDPIFPTEVTDIDAPKGLSRVGKLVPEFVKSTVPKEDQEAVISLVKELLRQESLEISEEEEEEVITTTELDTSTPTAIGSTESGTISSAPFVGSGAEPTTATPTAELDTSIGSTEDALSSEEHEVVLEKLFKEFPGLILGSNLDHGQQEH